MNYVQSPNIFGNFGIILHKKSNNIKLLPLVCAALCIGSRSSLLVLHLQQGLCIVQANSKDPDKTVWMTICMKCQCLFSGKIQKKYHQFVLCQICNLLRVVKVNHSFQTIDPLTLVLLNKLSHAHFSFSASRIT